MNSFLQTFIFRMEVDFMSNSTKETFYFTAFFLTIGIILILTPWGLS